MSSVILKLDIQYFCSIGIFVSPKNRLSHEQFAIYIDCEKHLVCAKTKSGYFANTIRYHDVVYVYNLTILVINLTSNGVVIFTFVLFAFQTAEPVMRRSIRKFNIPPRGNPPGIWTFEDWLVQIPFPQGKKAVQMAPPISTELPLLIDKFRLQSNTLHALWEIYAVMTPSNFFYRPFDRVIPWQRRNSIL